MDLSTFQLVDAMNDMDMLRNLSEQEHYAHQLQQGRQMSSNATKVYKHLQEDMNLVFQSEQTINNTPYKPHSSNQFISTSQYKQAKATQDDHFGQHQEDIFTPLISPAMTPSFGYQAQQQSSTFTTNNNDMEFSPLSSPAILPHQKQAAFQDQLIITTSTTANNDSNVDNGDTFDNSLSAKQIREKYEELEHAKQILTQKLTQLQKTQRQPQPYYYNDNSQQSTMSTESSSSNTNFFTHNNDTLYNTLQQHSHAYPSGSVTFNSVDGASQSLPSSYIEPATPASLMNMRSTSQSSYSSFSSSSSTKGNMNQRKGTPKAYNISNNIHYNNSSSSLPTIHNQPYQSPIVSPDSHGGNLSPMSTPISTPTSLPSQPIPPSPLTLLPTSEMNTKSSTKNEKRSNKKQRRGSSDAASKSKPSSGIAHTPTRALKPLLISPTLKPGHGKTLLPNNKKMPIASTTHEIQSVEEAERILATRSNYQNLIEGKAAALGIDFSTQIKSGLEIRRTAHKAAEQKRRDSLKEWFDRLRCEVEEGYVKRQRSLLSQVIIAQALEKRTDDHQGNDSYDASSKTRSDSSEESTTAEEQAADAMKPLSKVLLLQYAYEYISSLKQTLQEKDTLIEKLKATSIHNVNEADHNTKKRKADGNRDDEITKNLE